MEHLLHYLHEFVEWRQPQIKTSQLHLRLWLPPTISFGELEIPQGSWRVSLQDTAPVAQVLDAPGPAGQSHLTISSECMGGDDVHRIIFAGSLWPLRTLFTSLGVDGAQGPAGFVRYTRTLHLGSAVDVAYVEQLVVAVSKTFFLRGSLAPEIAARFDAVAP